MKTANTNRAFLKKTTLRMALCIFLISLAVKHATAQTGSGWTVGSRNTLLSSPNGKQWTRESPPATDANLNGVAAVNSTNVWAVGAARQDKDIKKGTILYYAGQMNGEKQVWDFQDSNTEFDLNGVCFLEVEGKNKKKSYYGWAVGNSGTILFYDGSQQKPVWTSQGNKAWDNLQAVSVVAVTDKNKTSFYGWAVGDNGTMIFYDGSQQTPAWKSQQKVTQANLKGVSFVPFNPNRGFAVGDSGTVLSYSINSNTNKGEWTLVDFSKQKDAKSKPGDLKAVQALNATNVYVVGVPTDKGRANVLYYDGNNWNNRSDSDFKLYGLSFVSVSDGWVVGPSGNIRQTPDGGKTWMFANANVPANAFLKGIVMFPKPSQGLKLDESTMPDSGAPGVNYLSLSAFGFPDGSINPANIVVQLARACQGDASATTPAVSAVSDPDGSKLVSFLLPGGLAPGKYFVSISDSADGDANFESSNCSEVSISR